MMDKDARIRELEGQLEAARAAIQWLQNEPRGPGEGLVSTHDDVLEQEAWLKQYETVAPAIEAARLTPPPTEEPER